MDKNFLIRIGDQFVAEINQKSQPLCVGAPSVALHLSYRDADQLCQRLRGKNYHAYVTNLLGEPASLEVIQQELPCIDGAF